MELLHDSLVFNTNSCFPISYTTPYIYYSGIFTTIYFLFDVYYDLIRKPRENALLFFHHTNGIVLTYMSLFYAHGSYMVYISHIMEVSSIFLSLKAVFKLIRVSEWTKDVNDILFSLSFLAVRIYLTASSCLMIYHAYRYSCMSPMIFQDFLIVYGAILYFFLTTLWSVKIVEKFIAGVKEKILGIDSKKKLK